MRTELCDRLGIEFPIFAFTHCRDVVVAVSQAGGFGVLGAVGFTPEQLEIECKWIDAHIGDKPYGVDIVIPGKYEGMGGEMYPAKLEEQLKALVPDSGRDFAKKKHSPVLCCSSWTKQIIRDARMVPDPVCWIVCMCMERIHRIPARSRRQT